MNSICLNITLITRISGNLLIFSTPTMAKYLEICLFISTKALKCVMVLEKAIKIYQWAPQGGLWACVRSLALGGCVAGDCVIWRGSAVWTLAPHFRVSAVSVGILGIGVRDLEYQNKYFLVWTSSSVNKSILLACYAVHTEAR